MDRPEEFESPTSQFVAECSNPIELRTENLVPGDSFELPTRCV